MTGRRTSAAPTASCGHFTCCARSPTSIDCSRSSARCRQSDGSYASSSGGTGDLGGTYTATIIIRWARLLVGLARRRRDGRLHAAGRRQGPDRLGGRQRSSGRSGTACWSATRRESITTSSWRRPARTATSSSRSISGWSTARETAASSSAASACRSREMSGYQADIGEGYWGCLYDESRRNKVLVPASAERLEGAQQDRLEPLHRPRDRRPDHPELWAEHVSVNYQRDRSERRALRAAGGADPRRRADGGPVQGRDDSTASHADRRESEPSRASTCERSRPTRASGSTRSTSPRATTARRSSR